jgi:hypothetical protein
MKIHDMSSFYSEIILIEIMRACVANVITKINILAFSVAS